MNDEGERLAAEIIRIGVTQNEFCLRSGIHPSTYNRKRYGESVFTQKDKFKYSAALEAFGGNPRNVWPEIDKIREVVKFRPSGAIVDTEQVPIKSTIGKPIYENSIQSKSPKLILIPGFDDCEFYLRSYDSSLQPKFAPGNLYAMREAIKEEIMYGKMYYLVMETVETFRILQPGKRPDSIVIIPAGSDGPGQEIYLDKIKELYLVLGMIQRF